MVFIKRALKSLFFFCIHDGEFGDVIDCPNKGNQP